MYGTQLYSLAEAPQQHLPPPPRGLDLYKRALLISQDRRHLFMTPCFLTTGTPPWPEQSSKPGRPVEDLPRSVCGGAQAARWRRDASPGCRRWWSPAHCSPRYGAPCSQHSITANRVPLYSVLRIRAPVLFDSWIRDRFFSNPGSPTHISESLVTIFWGKKYYNSL